MRGGMFGRCWRRSLVRRGSGEGLVEAGQDLYLLHGAGVRYPGISLKCH
jgi:hypothetical protein